jgi:predicted Zn-dependent peptidase
MKRLTEELVSEEELNKAKEFRVGNMYLSLETSDAFADFYSSQELYGLKIKTPEEKARKLQKVTAKEIREVARKLFVDRNLNLAIVGPYKNEEEFKSLLTFNG